MAKFIPPAEAPFASVVRLRSTWAKRRTTVLLTDQPEPPLGGVVTRTGFRVKIDSSGAVTPTGEPTMWILEPGEPVEVLAEDVQGGPL